MKSEDYSNVIEEEGKEVDHKVSSKEQILGLYDLALKNNFSVAIWRLPEESTLHMVIDSEGYEIPLEINLEELNKGFLFCPYDKGDKVFIRNHISFSSDKENPVISDEVQPSVKKLVEDLFDNDLHEINRIEAPGYYFGEQNNAKETTREEYSEIVEKSVAAIKSGVFEKVVPSKIKSIELQDNFDVLNTFFKLSNTYRRAFVYFVTAPDIGSWMGASPEGLIEIENGSIFRTVSLAGTQKINPDVEPGSVAWTQKEIEEQALVSRYIINCFKKIRLREFEEKGPKTVVAGKLLHLKTTFEVDLVETGFQNLGTVMLRLLHPTSAVCGMPLESANDFLQKVEKHDRKYFCGFLGPIDNSHNTHLYVNLRCMELFEKKAVLYAGAGITEDSVPEREWNETEIKCNTLLDIVAGK